MALALTAPKQDIVIALDGITVQTPSGTVQAVAPNGEDQNLPAQDIAMPLFNSLAA